MATRKHLTRRRFLANTGAVAAGAAAMSARSYANVAGANDRLNMAYIGCGIIAFHHRKALLKIHKSDNIGMLAVCDVWKKRADEFKDALAQEGIDVKATQDYRDVLGMKDLDYALIATPEHTHAYITLEALDAGKHVYVEKPMTHTVEEAQAVMKKVKETGLKLQVGVQGMSDDSYSAAHEAIEAGKLGQVVEAQVEYCRRYPMDRGPWRRPGDFDKNMAKPADLDWQQWLKPAPPREWNAPRYWEWRNYRDYSGGVGTDLFIHRISRVLKSTGHTFPDRAVGMGGIYMWPDGRELPDNMEMLFEYPAVGDHCKGMTLHVLGTLSNDNPPRQMIRGYEASIVFKDYGWDLVKEGVSGPEAVIETFKKTVPEDFVPHHQNHHAAIRKNTPLVCPVELGYHGIVAVRMGNKSWFEKKMMAWDKDKQAIVPSC